MLPRLEMLATAILEAYEASLRAINSASKAAASYAAATSNWFEEEEKK